VGNIRDPHWGIVMALDITLLGTVTMDKKDYRRNIPKLKYEK